MKSMSANIRKEPALVDWLRSGVWRSGFDRGSLSRAEGYLQGISSPETDYQPGESLICDARVKGSSAHSYHTRIGFFKNPRAWHLESECTCPVGLFCKHGAAMVLRVLGDLFVTKSAVAEVTESRALDTGIERWLEEVGSSLATAVSKKRPSGPELRFLAFCLKSDQNFLGDRRTWYLSMKVGHRNKAGEITIQDATANADPSNPPKYMAREDFVPAALYHQRKKKTGAWDSLRCEGDGWDEILEVMLETDRFYVWNSQTSNWWHAVSAPEMEVKPGWKTGEDQDLRPILEFVDGRERVILPMVPPYYIDVETRQIGRVSGSLPPASLVSWLKGPKVPLSQVKMVTKYLPSVSGELPVPVPMERVELPAITPIPYLKIVRKPASNYGYSIKIIGAELRFRYGDGPLLEPLGSLKNGSLHSEVRGGKLMIRPRDPKAETAARRMLKGMGFISLPERFPSSSVDAGAVSTYLLTDPVTGTEEDRWFDFLEGSRKASLVESGWMIEVTRKSGLFVRDAGELFAHLEESPEHGIDWFRFDAAFELDGKKVPLIPIIAAAIRMNLPPANSPDLPEHFLFPEGGPEDGMIRFPAKRLLNFVDQVRHLFQDEASGDGSLKIGRLAAAGVADAFSMDESGTLRALAALSRNLKDIKGLPEAAIPAGVKAELREYQKDGFRWLRFLADHGLSGILADDMGLGKTLQTLVHIAAEKERGSGLPSLVVAPTSVVPNWAAEAAKFTPDLKIITLQGKERITRFGEIAAADLIITSYALVHRDIEILAGQEWHLCVLDEAQYNKNSKAVTTRSIRSLKARHRLCLSGTPMENHLGELWSLMHFLMPGYLGDESRFNSFFRRPIERDRSSGTQLALNRRMAPLILRRTKDQVVKELPPKTELIHTIVLSKKQTDLYESVRMAMDKRVRDAIAEKGLAKSHIIVLDALLKLRQICCYPPLLKTPAAVQAESAKLEFLMEELLPTLVEDGRRILLFSSFATMLAEIGKRLEGLQIPFLLLTGSTRNRTELVNTFQEGQTPVFLISLKAGGTGLNLTAADTVIHYDPWWNPAAENQASDRAHRIGQKKPVFVHKLICGGSVEERIIELQKHKAALVQSLLEEETSKLKMDAETLSHLLAPMG